MRPEIWDVTFDFPKYGKMLQKNTKSAKNCSGLTFFFTSTPEWRVAGELLLVWSNNSMHSHNDELAKPPWEKNKAYAQDPVSQCLVGSLLHRGTPDLTPLRTFRLP